MLKNEPHKSNMVKEKYTGKDIIPLENDKIKCICCNRKIVVSIRRKAFCSSCYLYHFNLRRKLNDKNQHIKRLTKKLYGNEKSGAERIRFKI